MKEMINRIANIKTTINCFQIGMNLKKQREHLEKAIDATYDIADKWKGAQEYKILNAELNKIEIYQKANAELLAKSVKAIIS